MTQNEFRYITDAIKRFKYSNAPNFSDEKTFLLWYSFLCDIDYDVLFQAFKKLVITLKHCPTVAEFREAASEIISKSEPSPDESWGLVLKAAANGACNAIEEFNNLPDDIQRALGNAGFLRRIAMSDLKSIQYEERDNICSRLTKIRKTISEEKRDDYLKTHKISIKDYVEGNFKTRA